VEGVASSLAAASCDLASNRIAIAGAPFGGADTLGFRGRARSTSQLGLAPEVLAPRSDWLDDCWMREFVYLSTVKLSQFQAEGVPWWQRVRLRSAQISTLVGGAAVERVERSNETDQAAKLERIVSTVEESARYFTEPDVEAGDWVQFECRMGYRVIEVEHGLVGATVVFLNEPADVRLLLHGSAEHLVGYGETNTSEEERLKLPRRRASSLDEWQKILPQLFLKAEEQDAFGTTSQAFGLAPFPAGLLWYLVETLDKADLAYAPMRGYARITRQQGDGRLRVATPLYVAQVPRPVGC